MTALSADDFWGLTSRTATMLDRLLWRSVLAHSISVELAIALAAELAIFLPSDAFVVRGSQERN